MRLHIDNCYFNRLFELKCKMKTEVKIFKKDLIPDCFVFPNEGVSHSSKFLTLNS